MDFKKDILAVIPARAGSKRLKHKNLLPLGEKPLVAWSIEAAAGSKYVDDIVVSTDSKEIAEVAQNYGYASPFMRPAELATDEARSIDVVKHALQWYKENYNKEYQYVMLLQPTSPLRTAQNIDEVYEKLLDKNADAIVSVCEVEHNPLWSNVLSDDDSLSDFLKAEVINKRSQDLQKHYRLNGAIYLCQVQRLLKEDTFFIKDRIFAYKMQQVDSVDIDTELDLLIAKTILRYKEKDDEK